MYKNPVSGIWYADFCFKGVRYQQTLDVKTKSIAKTKEEKLKTDVKSGEYAKKQHQKKQRVPFSQVMQDYIDKVAALQRAYKAARSRAKTLRGFFVNKPLYEITHTDVLNYKLKRHTELKKRAERLEKPVTFTSINHELKLLSRLFNWYNKQSGIKLDNPVTGIERYREVPRSRILTDEEQQRFFMESMPQHVQDIVKLALITGMRKSEIMTLKKEDVTLGDLGGVIILKDTKNGEERKVPLTKGLTEMLKRIIKDGMETSPYLFTNPKTGKPLTTIYKPFKKACQSAGIENFKLHDSRHTFCTSLANEGVNPFIIMQIAGHKDTKTARRYCNPSDAHLMTAMTKLEKKSLEFSLIEKAGSAQDAAENVNNKAFIDI